MSKTIDEKVVEMRFDNSHFEQHTKETMSTLDKLKQKLNLSGASKGLENINTESKKINFSNIENSLSSLEKRFSTMGVVGMSVINNLTTSVMNFGRKITGFLSDGIINGGIRRATNLENAKFQLNGLLKDGNKVSAVMKNVNDAVDGTAYSLDAAANVASQLAASGMQAGDEMFKSLRGVAGVAAMTNSSYEDIGRIYTQVAGQGRLMGDQLLQLSGRGMNAAATLAQYLGKTEAEVRDMVSKGKIDFKTFAAAMDDAFGEHAKKANETFNGALSNVKASLARIGAEFVSPLIVSKGPLVQFLNALREKINEVKTVIVPFAKTVTDSISKILDSMTNSIKKFDAGTTFGNIISIISNLGKSIKSITTPIKKAFSEIFPPSTSNQFTDFTEKLKNITAKFEISSEKADMLRRTFKGLFSILDIGKKGLTAVFKPLLEFMTGSKISSIGDGILSITASIGDFFTKLNQSSSVGNAFIFIANGIAKALNFMGDVATSVFSKFDGIEGILSKIGNTISKFAGIVKNVLGKAFTWIKENISMGDVFAGLTGAGIFMSLKKLADLFGKVGKFFDKIGDTFKGFFKSSGTFKEVMGSIKDTLTSFQQGVKVASLVGIAIAITLLSSSIRKLSELKVANIAVGLGAMQLMIMELNGGFKELCKTITQYPTKGTLGASIALVAMAEAINILAKAMTKIGQLSLPELAKGLAGVLICIKALSKAMETISSGKNVITVRDSVALISMATACRILASSIKSIGSLEWDQWAKGLLGMGACIAALAASIRVISKSDGKTLLRDSIVLISMATACRILASAIKNIGNLEWEQWAKGLIGMGACIAALTIAVRSISKSEGKTLLRDSIVLISIATSCRILASAIKSIGSLSWSEWGRGLIGMGVCITALTASIKIISKSEKSISLRSVLAFIGIATSCKILASAIESIGYLEWDEWGRGLIGIGACITALTAAIVIISKTKNVITVRDILAFVGIATACKILASALVEIGSMSWDGIAKGLVGMGVALGELTAVTVILGKFVGGSAIAGAAAILIMSFSLGKIADALVKIGSMSWSEIGRGLVGMGGALIELGVVCGLLGSLTGIAGLVGAGTILLAVQGLDQLANALIKFGSMSWDEIGRGLSAMGGALSEIALGGLLNTLSGLGDINIAIIAKPLGDLADSFKKWGEIDYDTISTGLEAMSAAFLEIAAGGFINTLSGLGSLSIATIAEPLGTLADSVMKWKDVTIPEGLGVKLAELSGGIMSFTFSGWGADALATSASGIGQMADSVNKWKDVTVPEGIKEGLTNIADGVKAFSWAFMGGWSLSAITGPLGELPGSLSKWKDVVVPEKIKENLTNIADGIKAFSFAFMGGWSLSAIIEPLSALPGALSKWKDVQVPDNIKDSCDKIAEGIDKFSIIGAVKINSIAEPLNTLSNAFKKFSNLSGDCSNMITVAENIKTCCDKLDEIDTDGITQASTSVNKLADMFNKINGVNVSNVSKFVDAANKLNDINIEEIKVDTGALNSAINAIKQAMKTIESTIKNSKSSISGAMKDAVSGMDSAVKNVKSKTDSAITSLISSMVSKIKSKKSNVTSAFKSLVSEASNGIKDKKQSFVSAGKYLGEGLVEGIKAKKTDAYNAGFALGKAAVQGEKDGQQSNSPSKATIKAGKWLGEGLIIGIENMNKKVSNAGRNIGETATSNISKALDTALNLLNTDIDSQPTIKPVLDLSDVESRAGYLSSMFNNGPSLAVATNLGAISSGMNSRIQNGTNDDVISAINKLGKSLGNIKGDTYNINGITYDDGSNITDAVKTLVRAAKIERRV